MRELTALFVVAMSTACVAHTEAPAGGQQSPLEECAGTYVCDDPSTGPRTETLHRTASSCYLGAHLLMADGVYLPSGSWSGTAASIEICVGETPSCYRCDRRQDAAPSKSNEAHCTGSPDSCSSRSPGSCSTIRGCRMATHVHYNGTYDNECEGMPDRCDSIYGEDACIEQGCDWN